jgi:hypothetical protein
MYQVLIFYHTLTRWLVLAALLLAIFLAYRGYRAGKAFTKTDDRIRHWTATIAHIQLLIGMILYFKSPIIQYFWANTREAAQNIDTLFFSVIHASLMLSAIVVVTLGSAKAKRAQADQTKYRTMLVWYLSALVIIIIAIPWPFSPLAQRPYLR